MATICVAALMSTVQLLPFVLLQPLQELKRESALDVSLGVAKRVSVDPLSTWVVQVPVLHAMTEGLLFTFPAPFPDSVTETLETKAGTNAIFEYALSTPEASYAVTAK